MDDDVDEIEPAGDGGVVRVAAYAVCRRGSTILLVRASKRTEVEGTWFLPGGGLEWGETPADAVVREMREETGLVAASPRLLGVLTDVRARSSGQRVFSVRLIYEVREVDGEIRHETGGTSDEARWHDAATLATLPLAGYVNAALALSEK